MSGCKALIDGGCAYLVNSTPKYYDMVYLHFLLISRYWTLHPMALFFATEVPDHPVCARLREEFDVTIIPLCAEDSGFLDSRRAALKMIADLGAYRYVLPMQEDFLLEGRPIVGAIGAAADILSREGVASVRLMPCPGPVRGSEAAQWWDLQDGVDTYGFTFQATLWRLDAAVSWYERLCGELERRWPRASTAQARRLDMEIRANFAEGADGQALFWEWSAEQGVRHMGWARAGGWPNAVYLSPWPYRPTAIVRGRLEPWAAELATREGVPLSFKG